MTALPARSLPRDRSPDATLALLRDPYNFIRKRCSEFGSDAFEARILLRRTVCMTGAEAAELFYDTDRFRREGAAPLRLQKTLFGRGGVQGRDGDAHRDRKRMLLSVLSRTEAGRLAELSERRWRSAAREWQNRSGPITLYHEAREVLCAAVCEWAGVPLSAAELPRRTDALTSLFESAGSVGPSHWKGRLDRRRSEAWAEDMIDNVRRGKLDTPTSSALQIIAAFRDSSGQLLDGRIAAVELLNVLRPTVAVAVYVAFIAHAMHIHPQARQALQGDDDTALEDFVQEVRRFYPFFPAVIAVAERDLEWNGWAIRAGTKVILDLYGTNHDARSWVSPETFLPERFQQWDGSAYNLIPQGGGDHLMNHRCAGEWVTIELMKRAARFLATQLSYDVPPQDLSIDMTRLPALPRSGMVLSNIRTLD